MTDRDKAFAALEVARNFPANTCAASRHAAEIAEALLSGEAYPMLAEDPAMCGESIALAVAALWRARTELASLKIAMSPGTPL